MASSIVHFTTISPSEPRADHLLRAYFADIISRYQGRDATAAEVDHTMREESSDDLTGTTGFFVVAENDLHVLLACAGVRIASESAPGVGEVTRVFVAPGARGRGLGHGLLSEIERVAQLRGLHTLRLDVRDDLFEARRLYERLGYVSVPAFNNSPWAAHWFAKSLDTPIGT